MLGTDAAGVASPLAGAGACGTVAQNERVKQSWLVVGDVRLAWDLLLPRLVAAKYGTPRLSTPEERYEQPPSLFLAAPRCCLPDHWAGRLRG